MTTQQVKFKDSENNILGGILVDDTYIICACCGSVFEVDDVTIIEKYADWISFSYEIIND